MRIARIVAYVLLAVAGPWAVTGFWAHHALSDEAAYSARVAQAWREAPLRTELATNVNAEVAAEIRGFAGLEEGQSNFLADTAISLAQDRIEQGVESPEFAAAWQQWQEGLYADLTTIAQGGQPETTRVSGSELTVDIGPLVRALLSGGVADFAGDLFGDRSLVLTIDTESDVADGLAALGTLAGSRWWAALAVAVLLVIAAASRPARRGLARGMLSLAAGCAAAALLVALAPRGDPAGDAPLLSRAMADALMAGWSGWLWAAAATGGVAAAVLLLARGRAHPADSA